MVAEPGHQIGIFRLAPRIYLLEELSSRIGQTMQLQPVDRKRPLVSHIGSPRYVTWRTVGQVHSS